MILDPVAPRAAAHGPNFSLGNRVFRVLWMTTWLILARFTPPPFHGWRRLILRSFGGQVGRGARVYASVSIWHPGNLELGEDVVIGPGARLYNQGRIAIGARTVVSQRAHLCASSHDVRDPRFRLVLRPITIGEQCWVAAEAFVGPGVTMGDRSVLAARAALFGEAQPDTIYAGNPAEFLKLRELRGD